MSTLGTFAYGATAAGYTVAALAHVAFIYRQEWGHLARWATRGAALTHTLTLLLLVMQTGRLPIFTLFEAIFAVTWLLVVAYIGSEVVSGSQAAGAFLVPVACFIVVTAMALPKPGPEEPHLSGLPASLVMWHVGVTLLGYGFFVAAFIAGTMYLLLDFQLRRKAFRPIYYRLPSLEALDIWAHRLVITGFPLLTMGLTMGVIFAGMAWETPWKADPKVIWTALNWLVYAAYLLVRRLGGWGGRRAAWFTVAGFVALVVNYLIVNPFFSDLHRFGV